MIVRDRIRLVIYIILIVTLLAIIAFALSFLNLNGNITLPFSPTFLYLYDKNAIDYATDSTVKLICTFGDEEIGSQGSGFFALEPGVIVTCYHVIKDGPDCISAEMHQDRQFLFVNSVIGYSEEDDIAFLRFAATDAPILNLADANELENNQLLIAIGSPNGDKDTVSFGFFKMLDTYVVSTNGIDEGSSGGPLLNSVGNVVGVNRASSYRFCYSVPSEKVLEVWNSLNPGDEIPLKEFAENRGTQVSDSGPTVYIPA